MDTDGTITKGGSISFCSASEELIKDVYRLCLELGIHCYYKKHTGDYLKKDGDLNTYYNLVLFTEEKVLI